MKYPDYKYDVYIPKAFTIGLSQSSDNVGFPSMKTPDGKWTSVGVFEKICGFKPWTQRNEEKEITKALNQAVDEIENAPTTGFKIVDLCKNSYSKFTNIFDSCACATLRDPRGWLVTVKLNELQHILEAADFNVVDGEISGIKLMYAWDKWNMCFTLEVADERSLEIQRATSSLFTYKNSIKYTKPSKFEVGKVYSSSNSKVAGHKFMYMGVHDVYSSYLHADAILSKKYDIDRFLNDKNDITSRDVHVFYCIDFNKDSICHYYGNNIGASAFESSPYLLVKNLSKLFEDVSDSIEGDFTMYNDIAPVTYDAIADDMSKSALFNLIDLKSSQLADIYWPTFRDLAGAIHEYRSHERCECECRAYPLNTSAFSSSIVMHCSPHTCEYDTSKSFTSFCISSGYYNDKYNIDNPNAKTSWPFKTYFERKFTQANREIVLKSIYDELKPKVFQYKFMNGNDVPSYQNAKLNGITVRFLS